MKYVRKIYQINAIRYDGNNGGTIKNFSNSSIVDNNKLMLTLKLSNGNFLKMRCGDWILKNIKGGFNISDHDTFIEKYNPVIEDEDENE